VKFSLLFLSAILYSQTATAASECTGVTDDKAILACFDRANPPAKTKNVKEDFSDISSPFGKEEAATAAKLKGICRGC
jgi:hypothetical protein